MVKTRTPRRAPASKGLQAAGTLLACLGQVLLCLDEELRVTHASAALDRWLGDGSAEEVIGLPAEEILGRGLFGPGGVLRQALRSGESREGFRTALRAAGTEPGDGQLVSVAAAPMSEESAALDEMPAAFLVTLKPVERATPAREVSTFAGMVARSAGMLRIFQRIEELSESRATVLVLGESGTGKELIARALHRYSPRRNGPFVPVNCGGFPDNLLESELFGHVRGAFTGAVSDRTGRFEAARGGTLFLDEIGDLPRPLQVKLLRVLEEGAFERVGETRGRTSDARIIAATHVDLKGAIQDRNFREDLYFRLRVVTLRLPPLRERLEDVEPLATYLLAAISAREGGDWRLSSDTLSLFLRYDWPGNVRELRNALEHGVAWSKGPWVEAEHLPEELTDWEAPAEVAPPRAAPSAATGTAAAGLSPETLRRVLEEHRWKRAAAARALGISRSTLWRRLRELGW
jgi:transcriptional regulator with PAS, ATPase and Fis domain